MSTGKDLMDVAISFKNKEESLIKSNESTIFYFMNNSVWKAMPTNILEIKMRNYAKTDRSFVPDTRGATLKDVIDNVKAITYCENLAFDQFINEDPDKDQYYINFKNGIFSLRIKNGIVATTLLPHSENFFTVKQLNYNLDKNAK